MSTETIYLVGGGPSLCGFDWDQLAGRRVIAVNRAYEKVPHAEIVYFSDFRFWGWHSAGLLSHVGEKITGARRLDHSCLSHRELTGAYGIEMRPGKIRHGHSSGYAAINLAVHCGAKKIVLLGYDMSPASGRSHWHDGYPVLSKDSLYEKIVKSFDTAVEPLQKLGIEVWNASPLSKINSFPKVSLTEALP